MKNVKYIWPKTIHGQCPHHDSRHIKTNKKNWGRKSTISAHQNNPPVLSITPRFNLLALRNKLNPKSVLMVCVCVFSSFFYLYCIAFIYLHVDLKYVYSSLFLLCVIYFQKGEMQFLKLNRGKLHDDKENLM